MKAEVIRCIAAFASDLILLSLFFVLPFLRLSLLFLCFYPLFHSLKAEILRCIAAFASDSDLLLNAQLWIELESSQIVPTLALSNASTFTSPFLPFLSLVLSVSVCRVC